MYTLAFWAMPSEQNLPLPRTLGWDAGQVAQSAGFGQHWTGQSILGKGLITGKHGRALLNTQVCSPCRAKILSNGCILARPGIPVLGNG
jgi:hypothetical protein